MIRKAIPILIVGFWLCMVSLLAHREWQASQAESDLSGYAAVLRSDRLETTSQMGIYLGGRRIGFTRTANMRVGSGYRVESWTRLSLPILGKRPASVRAVLEINSEYRLSGFQGWITVPVLEVDNLEARGDVVNDQMSVEFRSGDKVLLRTRVPYHGEELFTNIFSPFAGMPELETGKSWRIQILNPLTRGIETATAFVGNAGERTIDGEDCQVFEVRLKGASVEATAWVTPEGEVVQQSIPRWGLMMMKETPDAGKPEAGGGQ